MTLVEQGSDFKATEAQKADWRERSRLSLAADPDEPYDMWDIAQAGAKIAHGETPSKTLSQPEAEILSDAFGLTEHLTLNALAHQFVPDVKLIPRPDSTETVA